MHKLSEESKTLFTVCCLAIVAAIGNCPGLQADTCTFRSYSGNWSGATTWSPHEPTSADWATIRSDMTATVDQDGEKCRVLELGDVENESGSVSQIAGNLTIGETLRMGCYYGALGVYDLSGGRLSAPDEHIGRFHGYGNFTQSGGTNDVTNNLCIGEENYTAGIYTLTGTGMLNVGQKIRIGGSGNGDGTFSWFHKDGLVVPAMHVEGVLEIGFDFNTSDLLDASLFQGSTFTTGTSWALVVTNGGTATDDVGSSLVGCSLSVEENGTYRHTGGTTTTGSVYLGAGSTGTARYELSGSAELTSGSTYVGGGLAGMGTSGLFVQTGGIHTATNQLMVGHMDKTGEYFLSGTGQLSADMETLGFDGTGLFNQTGGTNTIGSSLVIGKQYNGAIGQYDLIAGTLTVAKGVGHCIDVSYGQYASDPGVTGVFNLGDALGTGTVNETGSGDGVDLNVRTLGRGSGTMRGWSDEGTGNQFCLTGTLTNNGRVIADGYGVDRTLDLSSFSAVSNNDSYDVVQRDGTLAGWYAENHGKLVLPSIDVESGSNTYNWGEDAADENLDLVNSVRIDFTNVSSGGLLSIALLAPDHGAVPTVTVGLPVSVWCFSEPDGFCFGSADLTFRYDAAKAAFLGITEQDLRVFRYTGSAWLDITSTIDVTTDCLSADGVASFSFFAIGAHMSVPGDANGDGVVNEIDAATLAAHWGRTGDWSDGDFNNDGLVNAADASIVAANWGYSAAAEANGPAVPEPSMCLLMLSGAFTLLPRGRRRT